jgi:glycosyltransferase involved in cell wall biosynthesis
MPRVLLLCEYPSLNGGEHSLLAVLGHIRREGFDFIAAAPPQGPLADALARQDVEVIPFAQRDADGPRLPQQRRRRRLVALIADVHPDVVHANSLSMSRLSGPVVEKTGVPSIGHLRDIVNISSAAADDVNRHRRLLTVSHATRHWHLAHGVSAEKTYVLYNGVDLDRFRPRPPTGYLHRELGLPRAAQLIGAIGQIGARKGLDVLLEAAKLIAPLAPRAHFVVVGRRYSRKEEAVQFEAAVRRASEQAPLAGRFHFLGVRCDVDRLLNELSLLIHAARQEPLGRVLLEAASAGTPIVATRVGGACEIFPLAAAAAALVPPEDAAAVAAASLRLLSNQTLRRRLGQAARRRAAQTFDARCCAEALASHYLDVIG